MTEVILPCRYTLADLEAAQTARQSAEDCWANYSGNNPNKFHSQRHQAHMRVLEIEDELKRFGLIPYSEQELLNQLLDRLYPDTESRGIVEHEGRFFQIRYTPNGHSLSGRVKGGWSHSWCELTGEAVAAEREKKTGRKKR